MTGAIPKSTLFPIRTCTPSETSIVNLPTDVLGNIFGFNSASEKTRTAQTSKILHRVYSEHDHTLDFSHKPIDDDTLIESLKKRAGIVHSINLTDCPNITKKSIDFIATKYPRLQKLDVSYCGQLEDADLQPLSRLLHLESLVLTGCDLITGRVLECLKSSKLKTLHLDSCSGLSNADLIHLLPLKESLSSLHLSRCEWLDKTGIDLISQLNLHGLHLTDCSQLTDSDLTSLPGLLNLDTLDIRWCENTEGAFLPDLPTLQVLFLDFCTAFNGDNLRLPNLSSISLVHCPIEDDHLEVLCSHSTELRTLNLSDSHITDSALVSVGHLIHLRSLNLAMCDNITSFGLLFLRSLSQLTELSVAGCPQITDLSFETIASFKNLIFLDLSNCTNFSIKGLLLLSKLEHILLIKLNNCCHQVRSNMGMFYEAISSYKGRVYRQLVQDMPVEKSQEGFSSKIYSLITNYFTNGIDIEDIENTDDPLVTKETATDDTEETEDATLTTAIGLKDKEEVEDASLTIEIEGEDIIEIIDQDTATDPIYTGDI